MTTRSKVEVSAIIDSDTLIELMPITITGLPAVITPKLKSAIEALVCLTVNPYRRILACDMFEGGDDSDE